MFMVTATLRRGIRRTVLVQAAIAAGVSLVCLVAADWHASLSALYGGAIVVLASLWLGNHCCRAGVLGREQTVGERITTYSLAVLRFSLVLLLLTVGMGVLQLAAPPLIAAFTITHLGFLVSLASF
jgi:F0F1-type ATP synthase assembly protein I